MSVIRAFLRPLPSCPSVQESGGWCIGVHDTDGGQLWDTIHDHAPLGVLWPERVCVRLATPAEATTSDVVLKLKS